MLLELIRHVVSDLTDSVKGSISNLGVGVGTVLNDDGDHNLDLLWVIDILANLTESHNTSMFVSPVRVVCDCVHHKGTDKRQHLFLTD